MLNNPCISKKTVKIYTISVGIGEDKLALMNECEKDALAEGGTIISVKDENHMVIIQAEMPLK